MQQAIITVLQTLPTPVTITEHKDSRDGKDYYTYRVGTISEQQTFGIAMGATPDFLDAVRFSLEAAMKQSNEHQEGEIYDVAFAYANPQAHLSSFRQFLAPFTLLTLNDPIMEKFAEVRSYLRRRGQLISDFDILIGATALHHDLTLLTYNTCHFKRIPDLKLYPPAA